MKQGLVSVVIPIYNTEKYLNRCIESVVNQTYRNLEIILVDDGSSDNCPQMCDEWVQKDSRIRVVHKTNEGLGMARNTGLECAGGEYIYFLDSDDYIAKDTIHKTYTLAEQTEADVVCFGLYWVNAAGKIFNSRVPDNTTLIYENESIYNEFLPRMIAPDPKTGKDYNIPMSAWSKLISATIIHDNCWRFVSERNIISEDYYSLLMLFSYVKKISILPEALYYYCENNSSVTRNYSPNKFKRICHFYRESEKLCNELGYTDEIVYQLGTVFLNFTISVLKQEVQRKWKLIDKLRIVRNILNDSLLQKILEDHISDCFGVQKKILFLSMRKKHGIITYALLYLKSNLKLGK